ncbi:MAG: phage tail sheath family protein [Saprospiraceae bacterium]|nr:MAG: phage tail sheath family protein [Saprospiraceae bacterium]
MPNPPRIKTPGVYIEEVSAASQNVAQVETAIPAFIGYTEKATKIVEGDLNCVPTRISSFGEYVRYFGEAPVQEVAVHATSLGGGKGKKYLPASVSIGTPSDYRMYHALELFYENGGGPCYIVSVGGYKPDGSVDACELGSASACGGGLDAISGEDEITMILFPDANGLSGVNDSEYYGLFNQAMTQCYDLKDRVTIIDVKNDGLNDALAHFHQAAFLPEGLKFSAAYYPWLKTTLSYRTTENSILLLFEGLNSTPVSLAAAKGSGEYSRFITGDFLRALNQLLSQEPVLMPPSPAIAGIYNTVDVTRGVWKAPANVNVTATSGLTVPISDEEQGEMNVPPDGRAVNAIRQFVGRGILVWGARTLAGNDNDWRYINIRRFFNMVEESIKKATASFVFEPNDANTWLRVKTMVENYLMGLWRQGAMAGASPKEAFFVNVGLGKTMTQTDILEGRMILEMGLAAVRPAEFIVIRITVIMSTK